MTRINSEGRKNNNGLFLTDGGLETSMIFHEGFDLPEFAAFTLLNSTEGRQALDRYYDSYISAAVDHNFGFVIDTPTWRASKKWGKRLGFDAQELVEINKSAVEFCRAVKERHADKGIALQINGAIGPEDDGYNPQSFMTVDQAQAYHSDQIRTFSEAGIDSVAAVTMTYVEEAIGVTRAGHALDMPTVISFTVETDGRLPSGQALRDAIEQVDRETNSGPVHFMINCAHPDHFDSTLVQGGKWLERVGAVRANASRMSHAELDEAEELDEGNPLEFAASYRELMGLLPNLRIMGGCCGTDHRHVHEIGKTCGSVHRS